MRQKLAYFYFEDEPVRRSAVKLLTKDEALGLNCALRPSNLEKANGRPLFS
jgi:hypothetical protein